jgi:nucleoside-diphosphate-sugar epimerase
MKVVVTGGAGFFGSFLVDYLTARGHQVLSVDRLPDEDPLHDSVRLDITDGAGLINTVKDAGPFDAIIHAAALLAHDKANLGHLWASNVEGTRNIMECARALKIKKVVFTSTNCVFSTGFDRPVDESTPLNPIETYGRSKLAAEKIILDEYQDVSTVIVRCPTILTAGRLGLLCILFDFVREGRRLYLVGDGSNRYSFIAADDLANACMLAAQSQCQGVFHIGSDNVPTMKELYRDLMIYAGKKPRLVCIPEGPTVGALRMLNALDLSPLGPYHYRMLAANFVFDNSKLKRELGWAPTLTNTEILCQAYKYYNDRYDEINSRSDKSAHKSKAKAGVLNLLRMIS